MRVIRKIKKQVESSSKGRKDNSEQLFIDTLTLQGSCIEGRETVMDT